MSQSSRGKATRDDDTVITAEVPLKIADAVARIGTALGVRLSAPNEPVAAAAQELYVAKEVLKAAEGREKAAKDLLKGYLNVPQAKGKHIVHDSAVAMVVADQRTQPRRLSEEAVLNMMCKQFKLGVEEAKSLIDECKLGGDGYQMHLTVVLK